jgi:hypothetical protein
MDVIPRTAKLACWLAPLALALPAVAAPLGVQSALEESLASFELAASGDRAAGEDADNTGRNVRDRDERTLVPTDQGGSEADLSITAHIRKAIVSNEALSTNAQNVKIITLNGVVTLRGPVNSAAEKAAVAAEAQRAPGVKRVDNQLEVERN